MTVILAITSPLASAQKVATWSFDQVLQQSLLSHPSIDGKRMAQKAARADLDGAQWQRFPSFSADVPTGSKTSGGVLRLEQPLWAGGRIDASINLADHRLDAAGAAIEEERLNISLRVIAAYTEALRQKARMHAAEQGLTEHQRLLEMIKRRVMQSVSSQTDQRLAESRMHQAANELSVSQQAQAAALTQLSQLTGQSVRIISSSGIGVGEQLSEANLESALHQATDYSPTLRRLRFEAQAADSDIALQRSAFMPKVLLRMEKPTGGSSINADNGARAMLILQMQPGAGLSAQAGVDAAVARQEGARSAQDAAEREVRERFTLDWNEAKASRQRLGSANEASTTTTQVFESYTRQYVIGRKSWNDVLNAVREATQAQLVLEDTRGQAIAANLRLAAQTGNLTQRVPSAPVTNRAD